MKKKDIIIEFFFVSILGTLLHFTYDWFGKNMIIGIFSPINESVWEHTKLFVLPFIIWYVVYYIIKRKSNCKVNNKAAENNDKKECTEIINKDYWFSSMIISIIVAVIAMLLLFYFYNGAFGIESLALDLIVFFICVLLGVISGNCFYKKEIKLPWILLLIIIAMIYIIFTFYQPNIPLFEVKQK